MYVRGFLRSSFPLLCCLAAAACQTPGPVGPASTASTTFQNSGPTLITVEIGAGEVDITASDRPDTTVEVSPSDPSNADDVRTANGTKVERPNGGVSVKTPEEHGMFEREGSIKVVVQTPAGAKIDGRAGSADFHCVGSFVDSKIEIGSGNSAIASISGKSEFRAGSGHIAIDHASGDVATKSGSGDVTVKEFAKGSLKHRSGSGNLDVGVPSGVKAHLSYQIGSGSSSNTAPEGNDVTVDAVTGSGDITVHPV